MAGDDTRLDAAVMEARRRFGNSMDDDFNTAGAIASLHDLRLPSTHTSTEMPSPPDEGARAAVQGPCWP